jgi:hypothetical protein
MLSSIPDTETRKISKQIGHADKLAVFQCQFGDRRTNLEQISVFPSVASVRGPSTKVYELAIRRSRVDLGDRLWTTTLLAAFVLFIPHGPGISPYMCAQPGISIFIRVLRNTLDIRVMYHHAHIESTKGRL